MTQELRRPVIVKLPYVPDRPLVIEELKGSYPSPTLLIDGPDATGKGLLQQPSSRLDLPTDEQIMAALARASGGRKSTAEAAGRW